MQVRRYGMILSMVAAVISVAALDSCISKDIPARSVKGEFIEFEVEGQKKVVINSSERTVTIDLLEIADPAKIKLSKIVLSEYGVCGIAAGDVIDLTSPKTVIITTKTTNVDYEWTISATQTIERRFTVANQVGEPYFEEFSHSAFAYVAVGTDLSAIEVLELKLGPEGAKMTPEISGVVSFRESSEGDKTRVREVTVEYRGIKEIWSLYVMVTETQLTQADTFAHSVYLSAFGQAGLYNGFEYQQVGESGLSEEWIRIPDAAVTHEEGVFRTKLTGLDSETEYVARAFSGDSYSAPVYFTTEGTRELPGGSFDEWHKDGKVWNPWPLDGDRWWDTGNKGATTMGESNSVPTDTGEGCPLNPSGRAAYLKTEFVGIGVLGKIAGGNIYFGEYYKTSGTDGQVDIGHAWQHKPTKLTGYYKYIPQPVNHVGKIHEEAGLRDHYKDSTDSLFVAVALWASPDGRTVPFRENTKPTEFSALTRDTEGVVAYGFFATPNKQEAWAQFSIDIEYFNRGKLPSNTVLYISCTSSKAANYFTAGEGSLLYLDEMQLEYD